ncbi:MAG: hypothetical protein H6745_12855 [Deltaproteobacteria bacterium]|nr:hypothetical protein [Deltaproteobacteria bacterium]
MLRSWLVVASSLCLVTAAACGDEDTSTSKTDVTSGTDATVSGDTVTGNDATTGDTGGGGDTATGTPCDAVAQTGCAANQNCTYSQGGATPMCLAEGTVDYGDACGQDNGCKRGICLSVNATAFLCYAYCDTADDCDGGGACISLTGSPYKVCEITGIYTNCNLLTQDCPAEQACHLVSGQDAPICLPAGTKDVGADCTGDANSCKKGTACVNSKCETVCDTDASPDPCPTGQVCTSWYADQHAGYCLRAQ